MGSCCHFACLNHSQVSSGLQCLVIHMVRCLGYTAHTVRAPEQPCCGCLCISSCEVPLKFLLLSSASLAFRSPCNTHLFLHAWKSLFSRSCVGEAVVFNAFHSHLLFVHVSISALHVATFYLNHRVTCRASLHSTSESQKTAFSNIYCPHQACSLGWFE